MLFGENMTAVHSIEYRSLTSHFYLFGVRRASSLEWLSWDEVVAIAATLDLPHAPVWWRGRLQSLGQLESILRMAASLPSAASSAPGEGFVIRRARGFHDDAFGQSLAKYVRANHVQTGEDFSRKWKKAREPSTVTQEVAGNSE